MTITFVYLFIGLVMGAYYLRAAAIDADDETFDGQEQAQDILEAWKATMLLLMIGWPWFLVLEAKLKWKVHRLKKNR